MAEKDSQHSGFFTQSVTVHAASALLFGLFTGLAAMMFQSSGLVAMLAIGITFTLYKHFTRPHGPERVTPGGSLDSASITRPESDEVKPVIPQRKRNRVEGTTEIIEMLQEVAGPIDLTWPPTEANPSDKDVQFLKRAREVSKRSPDMEVKVGAIIVDPSNNKVLGEGFNRMPPGCEEFPWGEGEDVLKTKYPYVLHGVRAAILDALQKKADLKGATVYATLIPDNIDAQMIREVGISRVVYETDMYPKCGFTIASKKILRAQDLDCRRVQLQE